MKLGRARGELWIAVVEVAKRVTSMTYCWNRARKWDNVSNVEIEFGW